MSISFITWLTMPPPVFTPGAMSALMKCSGTFMWIFLFGRHALEIDVQHQLLPGMHLHIAQQHAFLLAVDGHVRIEAWKASCLSWWKSAL